MQHYISLQPNILSKQIVEGGVLKGWTSSDNPNSLINTETVSSSVLGLGAGADLTFEGGKEPLDYSKESNFFVRDHNVISAAVEGGSKPGFLCLGPNWTFEGGHKYVVEYFVRAASAKNCNAEVSVYDLQNKNIVATNRVAFREGTPGMNWTKFELVFTLPKTAPLSFRCYWFGGTTSINNMDLAFIKIKGA